jgi:hypothetical protein
MLPVIEKFTAARQLPDGHVFTRPWPAGPKDKRGDKVTCYQFRADRARRTLRGIDEQVAKAAAGLAPVKRNRFIQLDGAVKSVNRELEARARDLAGLKGYRTRSVPASTSSLPKIRSRPTSATPLPLQRPAGRR